MFTRGRRLNFIRSIFTLTKEYYIPLELESNVYSILDVAYPASVGICKPISLTSSLTFH